MTDVSTASAVVIFKDEKEGSPCRPNERNKVNGSNPEEQVHVGDGRSSRLVQS